MLKIKNISKSFNEKIVLKNISVEVAPGDIAVLLGASGSGKSTILRILSGLVEPDSGEIIFLKGGKKVKNIKNHVGIVFQNFNLFSNLTVKQNITLVLEKVLKNSREVAAGKASKLLESYGLLEKSDFSVESLSGGQKQRLAIARTLSLNPEIICMDEPTSALDPNLTRSIAKQIQELSDKGFIILVATHDTSLVKYLKSKIHLISEGKIIEFVDSVVFWKNPEKFEHLKKFIFGVD